MLKYLTVALLIISLIAVGCQSQAPETSGESLSYGEITPDEVMSWMEDGKEFQLVDVREDHEYDEAHIPGAILLPLGQLEAKYKQLDPEDVIVLVCRSGRRSGEAAEFLVEKGYTQVYNMVGGMLDWFGPLNQARR